MRRNTTELTANGLRQVRYFLSGLGAALALIGIWWDNRPGLGLIVLGQFMIQSGIFTDFVERRLKIGRAHV